MKTLDRPTNVVCPGCGQPIAPPGDAAVRYFSGVIDSCGGCGLSLDWWAVFLSTLRADFSVLFAFGVLGARMLIMELELAPHDDVEIRFFDHGVPADAHILWINYTPYGRVFPVEMHGNAPQRVLCAANHLTRA